MWLVIHGVEVVNEWCGRVSMEIDKSCPHIGSQFVELVEHIFFSYPLAQQVWHYATNIMCNTLPKEVTSVLKNIFQCCNASLINLFRRH